MKGLAPQPMFTDPGRFEKYTAGCLNVGKLVTLFVLAGWTLYQWNVSIFPKESSEEFARRAATRTDLALLMHIDPSYMTFSGDVNSKDQNVHGKAQEADSTPPPRFLSLTGDCTARNEKDFPISLKFVSMRLKQGNSKSVRQ
jgi:hypothetical protein